MTLGDGYVLVTVGLAVLLLAGAAGFAAWRIQFQIREGAEPAGGTMDLVKLAVSGPVEIIFALVGAALLLFALKTPQVIEATGLPISLCAPTRLTIQRADGGVNNTALAFIRALNTVADKQNVESSTVEALTNSLTQDGNLRRSLRDATLRTFLASDDIELWCRVDSHKLEMQSLSAEQKRMYSRVQEMLEAGMP